MHVPTLSHSASSRSSGATVPPDVAAADGDDGESGEQEQVKRNLVRKPGWAQSQAGLQPRPDPDQDDDDEERTALPPLPPAFGHGRGVGVGHGLGLAEEEPDGEEYLRVWTAPDLSNAEYLSLLGAFPPFITRRAVPRFAVAVSRSGGAMPDGDGDIPEREGDEIRFGTGTMWVSKVRRSEGYKGHWWTQFVQWWRRWLPCC